jgi:hypothetical protein
MPWLSKAETQQKKTLPARQSLLFSGFVFMQLDQLVKGQINRPNYQDESDKLQQVNEIGLDFGNGPEKGFEKGQRLLR